MNRPFATCRIALAAILPILLVVGLQALARQSIAHAQTTESTAEVAGEVFRIGLVQRGDVPALLDDLRPLIRDLQTVIERPVEILPMASYAALADAHSMGRVDLAFYATVAFLAADAACGCVEPLVAPTAPNGDHAFASILVTRRDTGFDSLDDLSGARLAVGPPGSLATWIWPRTQLASEGVDLELSTREIRRVASPVEALGLLAGGTVDAALIWGAASQEAPNEPVRGPLGQAARAGVIDGSEILTLWRSRPIPHGPVAIRTAADRDLKEKVRQFLIDLDETAPLVYDRLDRLYGGGFTPVDRKDYRVLRSLMTGAR